MGRIVKFSPRRILGFLKTQGTLVAFILMFVAASLKFEQFLSVRNISNIFKQGSMIGLVAVGMTFVILTGGIDLSVGAIVALSGVLAANLSKYGILPAIIVPVLVAAILGTINGLVITKLKIVPFIATLAMMMAVRGAAYISTGAVSVGISSLSSGFTKIARGVVFGIIPIPAIIFISVVIISAVASKHTSFGRHVYSVGGNEEASKMMGLKVDKIKIIVYTLSGLLAGLAGIILASRLGAGQPVAGEGWEMTAIASTVIGGTLLTGGVGKFSGTFIGVLIIGMITNIFNMQGNINTWWQNVLMGALLLVVIVVQSQVTKTKKA